MPDLPSDVITAAERLTKLARRSSDPNEAEAYRRDRDQQLAEYGYTARIRSEAAREVLVLYPDAWIEDGTVQFEAIDDTSRAVERVLEGTGEETTFEHVMAHNQRLVDAVEELAGPVHAANAAAFATFMANHYVRQMETASPAELREFRSEYYPRNVWPTSEQRTVLAESLRYVFEVADRKPPASLKQFEES